jgi:hypothetical protein
VGGRGRSNWRLAIGSWQNLTLHFGNSSCSYVIEKSCYSNQFLTERLTAPGFPALLVFVYLLLMFLCHAAESVTKSIRSGKVAVMTKLQVVTKSVLASVVSFVSDSVWAVGAEVAAA